MIQNPCQISPKNQKCTQNILYYGHRTFVLQLVTTFIANVNGDVFVDGTLEINNIQFNTTQISCLWFDGSFTQLLCWRCWSVLILCSNFFSHIALCGNLSQTAQYLFIQMLGMEITNFLFISFTLDVRAHMSLNCYKASNEKPNSVVHSVEYMNTFLFLCFHFLTT